MPNNDETLRALERMNKLLALVAVKDVENKEAVLTLVRAGFTQAVVASLLEMGGSAVSMIVIRHKATKPKKAKKAPKAARAATDGDGE
jgi:predicted transcriptional regulator